MLNELRSKLAIGLFDIGAISFGHFRLKLHEKDPQAPLSPIYINLRLLRSFPDVMDTAVDVYKELSTGLTFDLYADVPTAATPIVAILSHETRIPMVSPRKEEKSHGLSGRLDGAFGPGQIALLVDDLITLADSKLEAVSVLEQNAIKVNDVVVLVDRGQGGDKALRDRGYSCHIAFPLKELLNFFLRSVRISQDQYDKTIEYLASSSIP